MNKNQELKRKRFLDLGQKRMNAIKSLDSIQKLQTRQLHGKIRSKTYISTLQNLLTI